MNNGIYKHYATTPAPANFTGEDVIGDALYQGNQNQSRVNQIPQQLQVKAQQAYQNHQQEYIDPNLEEININQDIVVNQQPVQQSTTITKNVVINLVVNLKINAI